MNARIYLAAAVVLFSACSPVRMHRVRPDYAQDDRAKTKRLALVVQPIAPELQAVGEMLSLVARRYVNQKRNFLVKENAVRVEPFALEAFCTEGIEGVLQLSPTTLKRVGSGVESTLSARLLRCRDGQEVWAAEAGGSFASEDAGLKEVTQQYATEVGAEVAPYVAPAFHLLRPTLDTLPNPELTDADVEEKIELGE